MNKTKKKIIIIITILCVAIYFFINIFPQIYLSLCSDNYTFVDDSPVITLTFENLTDTSFITNEHSDANQITIKDSSINDLSFMNISSLQSVFFENCTFNGEAIEFNHSYDSIYFNCCDFSFMENFKDINVNFVVIFRTELENLSFIFDNFHDMTSLAISLSTIKSFHGIKDASSLKTLGLYGVLNEDISEISKLKNLETLLLNYLTVSDISFIKEMNIESLTLDNLHMLRDIDFITEMPTLTTIKIHSCEMAYSEKLVNYLNEMKSNPANDIVFSEEDLQIKYQIHHLATSLVNDTMSDREKVLAIVSHVQNTMSYDMRIVPNQNNFVNPEYDENVDFDSLTADYNEHGLKHALNGKGVCLNYTEITTVLLNEAGIKAYSITNSSHIWNLVQLDNEYFWLDLTSIDSGVETYDNVTDHPAYLAPINDYRFMHTNFLFNIPPQIYDDTHFLYAESIEYQKMLDQNNFTISS